jgi:hypothetical protein
MQTRVSQTFLAGDSELQTMGLAGGPGTDVRPDMGARYLGESEAACSEYSDDERARTWSLCENARS